LYCIVYFIGILAYSVYVLRLLFICQLPLWSAYMQHIHCVSEKNM